MRFLVDANLPHDVAEVLESDAHDVLYIPITNLRGSGDPRINAEAVAEGRIIVTKDLDFPLPAEVQPLGVVLIRVKPWFTRRLIRQTIEFFLRHPRFLEIEGKLTIVEPNRVTARPIRRA